MPRSKDTIVAGGVQKSESAEITPLMLQYQSIKDQHKDEVLFFRLGDFYEMFDKDAEEVSRLLNLTLTHRASSPMCGIPYHASKIYIARLLRAGKKIAICEQVGEIAHGKGLTERKVIEVITPGTATESEYLEGGANNFLAALFVSGGMAGYAYIDVTTADFFATSWPEKDMAEEFAKELSRSHPHEILLPEKLRSNQTVQAILSQIQNLSVSFYPDWNFDTKLSYRRLTEHFNTVNLNSFSLTENSPEVSPAGFLLDYLEKTAVTSSPHVSEIKVYKDSQFVIIDSSSRRNLEITENLRDGSASFTLLECVNYTLTAMGKRLLRSWLDYPLTDENAIRRRQEKVASFVKDRILLDKVREGLHPVLDIERLAGRIAMDRAHAKDLVALKNSLVSWLSVRKILCMNAGGEGLPALNDESAYETAFKIADLIDHAILDDPATSLTEGRIIKPGWSEELDNYRNMQENSTQILNDYLEEEKSKTGIQNLRIKSNNNAGYYIEVTKGKLTSVPPHFIFRRSLLNAERYTTSRLQEIERDLNEAETRINETERDLFLEVRHKIASHTAFLLQTAREIARIDVCASLAYAAILNKWVCPQVDSGSDFIIKNGRHPVVESHIPQGDFVPNDSALSSGTPSSGSECIPSFDLITGPNMAGKSTYLRQNALIALLAQIGSFVPADEAKIGVIDKIFCRVGASDNLARGESTFLVEMSETANILRQATEKSLVIMDEVGRGTSTEDGLSIAWAVSEYLLNSVRCKTLFATHYHELARLDHPALKLLCMAVSSQGQKIVFLRKIKEGASENSYGIHVARLAGIPDQVISRANEILNHLQKIAGDKPILENIPAPETKKPEAPRVPGLFSDEELILDEILSTEVDDITPRQALELVARWKKSLSGR